MQEPVGIPRARQEACLPRHQVAWARDGVRVLAHLQREGDYAAVTTPDLILLDLNMPRAIEAFRFEVVRLPPDRAGG